MIQKNRIYKTPINSIVQINGVTLPPIDSDVQNYRLSIIPVHPDAHIRQNIFPCFHTAVPVAANNPGMFSNQFASYITAKDRY